MYSISAEMYDLTYSHKDYKQEANAVASIIKQHKPEAITLLDIACGTGTHHQYLKERYKVDGVDLNGDFLKKAKENNVEGQYLQADMASFVSEYKYDVVSCLFSSIGYTKTYQRLVSAIGCFSQCLKPNGLLIVEPWFVPEVWEAGKAHEHVFESSKFKITRRNISGEKDGISISNFSYTIDSVDSPRIQFEEKHELGLFSKNEMLMAFRKSGFDVHYDEKGISGRGLYVCKKTEDTQV